MNQSASEMTSNSSATVSPTEDVGALPTAAGHGNTVAAWTTVIIMLVGCLVSAVAFFIPSVPVFWAGLAIIVIGLIVGWVLRRAGYGVGGSKTQSH